MRSTLVLAALLAAAPAASADPITWTDWTGVTPGTPGSASGTLDTGTDLVAVTYTGELFFAQVDNAGPNYWSPAAPYLSPAVDNAPPTTDIVALSTSFAEPNVVTFSRPIVDPILPLVSLGNPGGAISYNFDRPYELLSTGAGYWGNGPLTQTSATVLTGAEGHGAVRFPGTHSSIAWTVTGSETWHGFTVGITGVSVPEPAGALALAAASALGLARRRR